MNAHGSALAARFKNRLEAALKEAHPDIHGALTSAQRAAFARATKWVADVRHAGSGKAGLRYLARYVRRSASTDRRPLGYDSPGHRERAKSPCDQARCPRAAAGRWTQDLQRDASR